MKCPKCGYHSFDHLESCRKCGGGLAAHRQRLGLNNYVLSERAGAAMGEPPPAGAATASDDSPDSTFPEASVESAAAAGSGPEVLALEADELFAFSPAPEAGFPTANASLPRAAEWADGWGDPEEASQGGAGEGDRGLLPDVPGRGEAALRDGLPAPQPSGEESAALTLLHRHARRAAKAAPADGDGPQFAAATAAAPGVRGGTEGERAPVLRRLAAGAIDLLLLCLLCIAFWLAGGLALSADGADGPLLDLAFLLAQAIPYFLLYFFVSFGYFTLFHYLTGQTPGKMLLRLRVEAKDGAPLLFSQAFLRSVGGLLSLLAAGAGFWLILFDGERRGWNDRLAGSRVVPVELSEGGGEFGWTAETNAAEKL